MADLIPSMASLETRKMVVAKAKELAIKYKNSTYMLGGKNTNAFDCSYFVYLVMSEVFSNYTYVSSESISSSPNFKKKAKGEPGDIIFFPKGQVPYEVKKGNTKQFPNHVGIVIDSTSWVGRQSSSLGIVLFTNPWWATRACEYYTYAR